MPFTLLCTPSPHTCEPRIYIVQSSYEYVSDIAGTHGWKFLGKRGSTISMCNFRFITLRPLPSPGMCSHFSLFFTFFSLHLLIFGKCRPLIAGIYLFQYQLLIFRIYSSDGIIPFFFFLIFLFLNVRT